MASTTGNSGWAQLRQQARNLESQVSPLASAVDTPATPATSGGEMQC